MNIIGYFLNYPIVDELPNASQYANTFVIYEDKLWYSNGSEWFLIFYGDNSKIIKRLYPYIFIAGGE